ncbi:MAG: hypothetical protein Fur0018_01160 [Anaerolineales bacterium]
MMVASGIAAVKAGHLDEARSLLSKAAELRPTDATPWLWLSATARSLIEQRSCLESALAADPNNSAAQRGLVMLSQKIQQEVVLPEGQGVRAGNDSGVVDSTARTVFQCVQCGGRQIFDPVSQNLRCAQCGTVEKLQHQPAADRNEQVMAFVLPTERGHRWAESQPRLLCARCGAETIFPTGTSAEACPYCGAHQWLDSDESRALLDPHVIIPFRISRTQAEDALQQWLTKSGWSAPDDLHSRAQTIELRPAYHPFWTFDGTLEIAWQCEVNEGNNKFPRWMPRNGRVYQNFDDVLIPGLKGYPASLLGGISPFDLKQAVAFHPAYLAGWPALSYDLAMSDASLLAREQVVRRVRRTLGARLNITQEKRALRTGGVNWSGMTFKYILLPVWMGAFRYGDKTYPVWVNAQTGKVGGEKPRDFIKLGALLGIGLFSLALLAFLAILLTR